MKRKPLCALLAALMLSTATLDLAAQTQTQRTAFTYQGQLNANGALPTGLYQFTFTLYDAPVGGNPIAGATPLAQSIQVINGLFTTDLDFGQIFNGSQCWLEIKVGTTALNQQPLAARQPINSVPVAQYALNVPANVASKEIHFSTGQPLNGASVVSFAPILMGFGNNTVEITDGFGDSTMPPQMGGFSFPIPFDGTIDNLQVSADLLVASVAAINTIGLQYEFTVFRAPSAPNNGIAHVAQPYLTTPLVSTLNFGSPFSIVTAGTFYSATNANPGTPIAVAAGDRIGIRVRTSPFSDPSASDVTQLAFSATLSYTPAAQ